MHYHHPPDECLNCHYPIHATILHQSISYHGYALCPSCQESLKQRIRDSSRETLKLYFSLKKRGVPAELERAEGWAVTDIAVADARLNIEVDAPQPNCHPQKALADLRGTYYTNGQDSITLHIPNALVAYNLEETADYITELLQVGCRA